MTSDPKVVEDISNIIKGIFTSFEDHDPEGIEKDMHPDATVWDVFTPHLIRGTKEREKFHADDQQQMQKRGPLTLTLTLDDTDVESWDDTAIARYYLRYKYEPPNATEGEVRITDVFRKVNGKWVIVHHHEGAVPTGIPPLNE